MHDQYKNTTKRVFVYVWHANKLYVHTSYQYSPKLIYSKYKTVQNIWTCTYIEQTNINKLSNFTQAFSLYTLTKQYIIKLTIELYV